MLSFFKRKGTPAVDFSGLGTDMHSHLLPGIDDGSPDTETSIQLIKGMMELGYKKFICTPHVMQDMYKNNPKTIGAALESLQNAVAAAGLPVKLHAAAEYLLDENFEALLQAKTPLLTLHDNKVLIEFSFVSTPLKLNEALFQLQINGYQPVLAHPERYSYLLQDKSLLESLKNSGCLFQLNLLSLTNYYGKIPAQLAEYLLDKDYIDLLGTDLHHARHLAALRHFGPPIHKVLRLIDRGRLLNSQW